MGLCLRDRPMKVCGGFVRPMPSLSLRRVCVCTRPRRFFSHAILYIYGTYRYAYDSGRTIYTALTIQDADCPWAILGVVSVTRVVKKRAIILPTISGAN